MKPFMWQCICLIFELYKNDFLLRSSKRYESKLYSHIAQLYIMHIFLSVLSQSTVNLFPSGLNIGPIVKHADQAKQWVSRGRLGSLPLLCRRLVSMLASPNIQAMQCEGESTIFALWEPPLLYLKVPSHGKSIQITPSALSDYILYMKSSQTRPPDTR